MGVIYMNRRDMITLSSLAAAVPALGSIAVLNGCSALRSRSISESSSTEATTYDQATYDFWTKGVRNPEFAGRKSINSHVIGDIRATGASFVYYDDKYKHFVAGSDIGDDDLPKNGTVEVIINVSHIRPSTVDRARFEDFEGGSLRIDLQQSTPLPSLAERLAWTAIAGFLPENKKLPALKEMTFDPGTTWGKLQTVPLPNGGGLWTWNFFLKKKQSRWMRFFDFIRRSKNLAIPILGLGLPAIAITALNTVDNIVAELTKEDRTEWLFQNSDTRIYATQNALNDLVDGQKKLRLKNGIYVVIPEDQFSIFGKEMSKLTIKDGLVVPKNTPSTEIFEAAKDVVKDVTYLTVGVKANVRST
jgi:hypothetical protein